MAILQELTQQLRENVAGGATGAHGVAAHAGLLFGGKAKRVKRMKAPSTNMQQTIKHRNSFKWKVIGESADDLKFDMADVLSKLDDAEKKAEVDEDTVTFGMEDEDGNVVKVYVRSEQAEDFEAALGAMLSGEMDDDEDPTPKEIAEILFQLKDQFDIIDVQWPTIEGDEEEEQEAMDQDMDDMDSPEGDEEFGDEEVDDEFGEEDGDEGPEEVPTEPEMEPAGGVESSLQQIIDMMKADAEARKAESEARAAEAEARAAEANAAAAAAKVKQEEQILDMEAHEKEQKEQDAEAKRLARLAKWKHSQASAAETAIAAEDEEESCDDERMLSKDELMELILKHLRANG